ncbi:WD and tetratricopeptide repeats protein 1 [Elysia marginata]|uniref:WD and tetratricopeptide repeats protein 1 n=1 Tax=Elysia marginata TaxID=1093978 RepID=A0AAV4FH05_9GAST|nr:WD and tetratricopeptide repeats protein 1 [Elysia marginata]
MASLRRKFEREIKNGVHLRFQRREQVTEALVKRLGLEKELEGHGGCVNCLEWNSSGSLLASGSDDLHVMLWNPLKHKTIARIRTGHQGNIFSVKFLPHSNDSLLVTGAADHRISVHDVNQAETTHVFNYHLGRVKRIATAPNVPYLFWSAAEDGTIMQFDLRCTSTTTTAPNNILINMNVHMGMSHYAEAKCLAINPVRPEMLAIGANDPYVRVFDRRMLNCSSFRNPHSNRAPAWDTPHFETIEGENYTLPPDCAQYYIAGHLPQKQMDYKKRYRTLASTYVTFGPDGTELLVNLGGEQIYLYDVNNKLPLQRFDLSILESNPPVKEVPLFRQLPEFRQCYGLRQYSIKVQQIFKTTSSTEHDGHSKNGFSKRSHGSNGVCKTRSHPDDESITSTDISSQMFDPTSSSSSGSSSTHHSGDKTKKRPKADQPKLSKIAEGLKKHANDLFGKDEYKRAIDAYNQAIAHSNNSAVLYANRALAYLKRKWDGDQYAALRDCYQALTLDPNHMKAHFRLARCLHELSWSQEAFECLRLFKQQFPDYAKSQACDTLDRDIKASIFSQTEDGRKDKRDEDRQGSEQEEEWQSKAGDYALRFCGHCNTTTDIKEANFFGSNGQYVVAGSDDGSFFIWDKNTTNIVRVLRADESIVNCLQPHPSTCLLATSGIDPVVRLWSPRPEDGSENDREVNNCDDAATANQKRMNADPLEVMLRNMGYRISGFLDADDDDGEGGGQGDGPANCRTS